MGSALIAGLDIAAEILVRCGTATVIGRAVGSLVKGCGTFTKIAATATACVAGFYASDRLVDYSKLEIRKFDNYLKQKMEGNRNAAN